MVYLKYDLNDERVQYLISSDEILKRLISYIKTSSLAIEEDGFSCLVKYIIGQQISDKARETIWKRLNDIIGNISPQIILSTKFYELKEIGLSSRKVEYIRILAKSAVDGEVDFEKFQMLSNKEIITKLTSLKGIGQWTAEMYLIFSLGRENVLSKGDRTIRRVIQWMYSLKELPSSEALTVYFAKWTDYATIVSSYLWKAVELGVTCKPFDKVIP